MKTYGHPSFIRQVLLVAGALAIFASGLLTGHQRVWSQDARGPASVAAGKVAQIRSASSQSFVGTLHAQRKSTVGTAVDGRVVAIDLFPGDLVTADQPVVQLRTGTLEIQISAAVIALNTSQQALQEMAVSMPKEIELAQTRMRETEARLKYSKTDFDRSNRLHGNSGAISQSELELARSRYRADEASASAAKIEHQKLESTKTLRLTQAQLAVETSQLEVDRLNDLKKKYTVRAPFEGVVTQRLTEVGEWVTQGQPVVEVLQLDPIELIVNVPQGHLQRIQTSLAAATKEAPLTSTIAIDGIDGTWHGAVERIVSQADLRSRTFPVRIKIQNRQLGTGYLLQPGMLGRASLQIGSPTDMLMVKKDALVLGGGRTVLFKIDDRGGRTVVVGVPVKTGTAIGGWIQVVGNIAASDQVVVLGNERLRTGDEVTVSQFFDDMPRFNGASN